MFSDVTRSGVIMCKTDSFGYYPSAFYKHREGLCSFEKSIAVNSLIKESKEIQYILGKIGFFLNFKYKIHFFA